MFVKASRSHFKNTFVTVYAIGRSASLALSRVLNCLKGRLAFPPIPSPSRQSIFEMTSNFQPIKGTLSAVFCTLFLFGVSARADDTLTPLSEREIPGKGRRGSGVTASEYESLPSMESYSTDFVATPDRWRLLYQGKWYDPYNQNVLKADVPIFGLPHHPWFLEISAISDASFEFRNLPTGVGGPSTVSSGRLNTFGGYKQFQMAENLLFSFSLIRGNTSFMPPELEFRFTPVINVNYADIQEQSGTRIDPTAGTERTDNHIGIQELFADVHLANISERYDFISTRIGIQSFVSDFRGFVFNSQEPGVRVFGDWDNNRWQYNMAWFSRLDKDTNTGLNSVFEQRYEDVFLANVYRQDLLALGHTTQFSVIHRQDLAGDHPDDYDNNGFLVRPAPIGDERDKNIYSTYLGVNSDGHIGRVNLTTAMYYVFGAESHNPIAQRETDIQAGMGAAELSYDIDWVRLRTSIMWASGDSDPFDDKATGFDSIVDNPNFAGGDISYIQRQGIPLIGGGGVNLFNRNSLYPSVSPGRQEGQANFVNPGLRLYNVGADFELLPELKLITNLSFLQFDQTDVLQTLRQDGSIGRDVGVDISAGILYRPFLNNNVQFRFGVAGLLPSAGLKNLYGDQVLYDVFGNVIFLY